MLDPSALTQFYGEAPAFTLALTRISCLIATAPVLGGPYLPGKAKALLATALALILQPSVAARMPVLDGTFPLLLAQEAFVGLSLGFMLSLAFHGVRFAGDLINRYAGFNAAENFDPEADVGEGPFGELLYLALLLLLFATDTHHYLIAVLAMSFSAVPPGAAGLDPALLGVVNDGVRDCCLIAAAASFPVLGGVLAVTVAEGILTRAVPQINLLHISFAIKILVSVLIMFAGLPAAVAFLGTVLQGMQSAGYATLKAL